MALDLDNNNILHNHLQRVLTATDRKALLPQDHSRMDTVHGRKIHVSEDPHLHRRTGGFRIYRAAMTALIPPNHGRVLTRLGLIPAPSMAIPLSGQIRELARTAVEKTNIKASAVTGRTLVDMEIRGNNTLHRMILETAGTEVLFQTLPLSKIEPSTSVPGLPPA